MAQFTIAENPSGKGVKRNPLRDSYIPSSRDSTMIIETNLDLATIYTQPTEAQPVHFVPSAKPYLELETALCCSEYEDGLPIVPPHACMHGVSAEPHCAPATGIASAG